jgi:hypothetical protein
MTWKQKTLIRILLLIAKMFAEQPWVAELNALANHIQVGDWLDRIQSKEG